MNKADLSEAVVMFTCIILMVIAGGLSWQGDPENLADELSAYRRSAISVLMEKL